jgi:hypothetical protein
MLKSDSNILMTNTLIIETLAKLLKEKTLLWQLKKVIDN